MVTEDRITNAATGGAKGSKPCQPGWLPAAALEELGRVAGYGASKYSDGHNYRRGYEWSLSINAAWRHFLAFQRGEDCDPESGCLHLAHAAWHMLNLVQQGMDNPHLDDRWVDANGRTNSPDISDLVKPDSEWRRKLNESTYKGPTYNDTSGWAKPGFVGSVGPSNVAVDPPPNSAATSYAREHYRSDDPVMTWDEYLADDRFTDTRWLAGGGVDADLLEREIRLQEAA